MKKLLPIVFMMLSVNSYCQEKEMVYLWPGKVPGEEKEKQPAIQNKERKDIISYSEVTNPLFEVFLPSEGTGNEGAVVVCPGGAYKHLSYDKEGTEVAAWLNKLGYAAFVLQYRVPDKREGALQDAQRAIRIIRHNVNRWKLNASRIGIMGFSAGGSLSARTSTLYCKKTYTPVDEADSLSCRPDFTLLIYPAYLDEGEGKTITTELKITNETPVMFIFQTADDPYCNSSLTMAGALRNAKVPVELHILANGGHGYGLRTGRHAAETWPLFAEKWLNSLK